jgi:hypothetical protein
MDFLFLFQLLIGVIAQRFGRINYCPAPLGGLDNKKAYFRHFLNSSKLSIVAARSCCHTQVMLQTVTLFYIHCGLYPGTKFIFFVPRRAVVFTFFVMKHVYTTIPPSYNVLCLIHIPTQRMTKS